MTRSQAKTRSRVGARANVAKVTVRRLARVAAAGALFGAVLTVAVGAGQQAMAEPRVTHYQDTCHSHTAVMYGYRMPFRQGSYWVRSRDGSYDETFAIRRDGEVMHAWPGHGSWSPVSNGRATNVMDVTLWDDHTRTVCVETSNHYAYQSRYDPHTQRWGNFTLGCANANEIGVVRAG